MTPSASPVLDWPLILIVCGAVYVRRRYPVTVAVLTLLACSIYYHSASPTARLC